MRKLVHYTSRMRGKETVATSQWQPQLTDEEIMSEIDTIMEKLGIIKKERDYDIRGSV